MDGDPQRELECLFYKFSMLSQRLLATEVFRLRASTVLTNTFSYMTVQNYLSAFHFKLHAHSQRTHLADGGELLLSNKQYA